MFAGCGEFLLYAVSCSLLVEVRASAKTWTARLPMRGSSKQTFSQLCRLQELRVGSSCATGSPEDKWVAIVRGATVGKVMKDLPAPATQRGDERTGNGADRGCLVGRLMPVPRALLRTLNMSGPKIVTFDGKVTHIDGCSTRYATDLPYFRTQNRRTYHSTPTQPFRTRVQQKFHSCCGFRNHRVGVPPCCHPWDALTFCIG